MNKFVIAKYNSLWYGLWFDEQDDIHKLVPTIINSFNMGGALFLTDLVVAKFTNLSSTQLQDMTNGTYLTIDYTFNHNSSVTIYH